MIKRFTALFISAVLLMPCLSRVQAVTQSVLTCTPVEQIDQYDTTLECRLVSDSQDYLLVGKYTLPFHVTELIKVTSMYAAAVGVITETQTGSGTIAFTTMGLGDANNPPRFQPAPLDSLSFLVRTDESMAAVNAAFTASPTSSLLMLSPSGEAEPNYVTVSINQKLAFDGSLILEAVTKYANSVNLIHFLSLAQACFEKSASVCLSNLIQNL